MNDIVTEIERIADDIKEVLDKNRVATPNTYAASRLSFLANLLPGGYAREKAREIALTAEDFYSSRKHEKYTGGAPFLFANMEGLVSRIKNHAKRLEKEDKNA